MTSHNDPPAAARHEDDPIAIEPESDAPPGPGETDPLASLAAVGAGALLPAAE